MTALEVVKTENKPKVEGVQLLLGVEGEVDREIIETIKGIEKEALKLQKMKYLGNLHANVYYHLRTDPNTLAFAYKYLGFRKPSVGGDLLMTSKHINFHDRVFYVVIYLNCPFEVQVE